MSHQVLSRKYRPQCFSDMVGQEHMARILQNAIAQDRVGHAYLFVGPRGVGKTTAARIVARALNCDTLAAALAAGTPEDVARIEPCGTCNSCRDIAAGSDLDVVEMDAASNNAVDDVRALREQVGYATIRSRHRIWIVDEVHMLSLPAFNAFLKTLEEPPPQVKFLFCTTEEHKLPDTFRSRCQRVEFRPIEETAMAGRLEDLAQREGIELEPGLTSAIARAALGGLRDAESQLEQLIAARERDGPIQLADLDALSGRASGELLEGLRVAIDAGDAAASLDAVDACLAAGAKPGVLLDQWLEDLRARLVMAVRGDGAGWARVARAVDVLLEKRLHMRAGAEGGLVLQVAAVTLARLPDARDLDALIGALRGEVRAEAPSPAASPPAPSSPAPRGAAPGSVSPGESGRAPAGGAAARPPAQGEAPPAPDAASLDAASLEVVPLEVAPLEVAPLEVAPLDAAALRARWPEVLLAAAARSPALGRALERVRVGALHDGIVELTVPEGAGSARATLMRKEIQLACTQVLRDCTGETLRPIPVAVRRATVAHQTVGEDMRSHPAVQLVTETTGGRLLNVERSDGTAGDARGDDPARDAPSRDDPARGRGTGA